MGEVLWYGLAVFGVLLGIFFVFMFIFRPLIRTYLSEGQGWYLTGFIGISIAGFFISKLFTVSICTGLRFNWLCNYSITFFIIVLFCFLFWYSLQLKGKEV